MKSSFSIISILLCLLSFSALSFENQWNAPEPEDSNQTRQAFPVEKNIRDVVVFQGGQGGSSHYRIPSLMVAKDGSVLAFAEGRASFLDPGNALGLRTSIKMRRSTNNGIAWGDYQVIAEDNRYSYSDPRPMLDEKTGRIIVAYVRWNTRCAQNNGCVNYKDPSHDLQIRVSEDNGETWSEPRSILNQVKDVNWYANGNAPNFSRATWSRSLTKQQLERTKREGWRLGWNARAANGTCNIQSFSNKARQYQVELRVDADTKQISAVIPNANGSPDLIPLGFDVSGYNDYLISANRDGVATVSVNGKVIKSNWLGVPSQKNTITWGNGCSNQKGSIAYQSINFWMGHGQTFPDISFVARPDGGLGPMQSGWRVTSDFNGKGDYGWVSLNPGPGHGIQLESGRLIFPAIMLDAFKQMAVVSIYTDDGGNTWRSGNQTPTFEIEPTESDLVQLKDGSLLLTSRNDGRGSFNRYQFISEDNGINWKMIKETPNSTNGRIFSNINRVDVGLTRFKDQIVLMTAPAGKNPISSDRNNLALWVGRPNGIGEYQYSQRLMLVNDYSAYSDLIRLNNRSMPNENLGVIYEASKSTSIRFLVYDMDSKLSN